MKLTEVESMIFSKLQMHVNMQEVISLAKLADECHVAQSTIIKMAQKMGYSGFVELRYQLISEQTKNTINQPHLMSNLILGDADTIVDSLLQFIIKNKNEKNIIHKSIGIDILGNYISRKLAFFDIFAPATYDYTMTSNFRIGKGFIIFPDTRPNSFEYILPMLQLSKQEGYKLIAFGEEKNEWLETNCDLYIRVPKTPYKDADMYPVKLIILFELIFSKLATKLEEDKNEK